MLRFCASLHALTPAVHEAAVGKNAGDFAYFLCVCARTFLYGDTRISPFAGRMESVAGREECACASVATPPSCLPSL